MAGKLNRRAVLLKGKLSSPGVFMLHRCHNLRRTSLYRLSLRHTIPVLPKEPFGLSIKHKTPPPSFFLKFEKKKRICGDMVCVILLRAGLHSLCSCVSNKNNVIFKPLSYAEAPTACFHPFVSPLLWIELSALVLHCVS